MPNILAVGTILPDNILTQREVRQFARNIYGEAFHDIDRLVSVFDNAEIEQRHFCVPLDWFGSSKTFEEKNDLYISNAISLSASAIALALGNAGLTHADIDYLIFVSTTGISTPSIDAQLIQRLPFRRNIKRLPIWGLGCAGGAASLSRAMDIARANPAARILVVITELCGLTFLRNDLSKSALIATSLFADGSAAVVVGGDDVPAGPRAAALISSRTTTMDDSLDVMGWDIGNEGFKVMISRDIPAIVRTFMRDSIEAFLEEEHLSIDDIDHFIAHPGGAKVLQAYIDSLDLPPEKLEHTRSVLRTCGNMSACSVIFVLEKFLEEIALRAPAHPATEYGLLGALGPGFASELVLLRWQSPAESN
ncbi:MAG: 3-oxoacyl-[acyl-carrier-protein] synthase III C-terminal domain-containing protein [Bacteroidota bacterium]